MGDQEWTTFNLNVNHFRNGDLIPEAKSVDEWSDASANRTPAWCYYNNDPKNGVKYGRIYNYFAITDSRGLAPEGWHIPTTSEWQELVNHLGGTEGTAHKLKSKQGWKEKNGDGTTTFNALPAGIREFDDEEITFFHISSAGFWWSTTEGDGVEGDITGEFFAMYSHSDNVGVGSGRDSTTGLSIRCVKDK